MDRHKICFYIYDKKLLDVSKNIPNIGNRAAVVQSLIATYNLFKKCKVTTCEESTDEDLLSFHSSDYLECLKKAENSSDLEKITDSEEFQEFNLGYDCPLFENLYTFAKLIAGSSLTAAKKLVSNNFKVTRKVQASSVENSQPKSYLKYKSSLKLSKDTNPFEAPSDFSFEDECKVEEKIQNKNIIYNNITEVAPLNESIFSVCINWFGGWHHAQRDEAGGFCYVNDIVISIQYLLKFFKKVLYIDLDIHHGNGVENAFIFSPRVLTFSMHKYEAGFYPATGSLEDIGKGKGKFYTVNAPLKSGITDDKYFKVFNEIFNKIMERYKPDCLVVQCGSDGLSGDPLGGFNLTLNGIGECMKQILRQKLPTMVLGGGGYNVPNTARCWAYLTSLILGHPISNDIPDNSFLHLYGPEFELRITAGLRKDENSEEYLQTLVATILKNLDEVSDKCHPVLED